MDLRFTIDPATCTQDMNEIASLREAVFGNLARLARPPLPLLDDKASVMHLVARLKGSSTAVAAVTVIDTTYDAFSRATLGVSMPAGASSALYTSMMVAPEYRGLCLPVRLMFEAKRHYMEPRKIRYTWLLYESERASSTRLCRILNYRVLPKIVRTPGRHYRVLMREEPVRRAEQLQPLRCSEYAFRDLRDEV
jgi:hypothetical protein